jgi:predicted RND superfamily exporter protein
MGAAEPVDLLGTSTARAVMFSATTTIASFGTLAFASHRGMASLGQLLTVGVAYTVVGNLILLPALITLRDRRAKRFRTRPGQTAILPD